MESSAERGVTAAHEGGPLDASWRALSERRQESVLPAGRVVVSCPAPLGGGGLGRHLEEIVRALERRGAEPASLSETTRARARGQRRPGRAELLERLTPLVRFSPPGRMWMDSVGFDAYAARELPPAEHLIAF